MLSENATLNYVSAVLQEKKRSREIQPCHDWDFIKILF